MTLLKIRRPEDFIAEFNRLKGLKNKRGKYKFKNGEAAFEYLNKKYFERHDEKRYATYNSFRAALTYHNKRRPPENEMRPENRGTGLVKNSDELAKILQENAKK